MYPAIVPTLLRFDFLLDYFQPHLSIMELVHQLLDEVAGEGDEEGVADDRQLGQHLHDREPDTWMFSQVM